MADETRDNDPEGSEPTELPPTASSPPTGEARDQIGPYRLLQKVGEGGMGEVYKAEQTHPVRRLVALKVIKAGMDTKQVVARFEAERQALAMMDHPAVAKVFDAGSTPHGRPYFAMEYVKGVPVTEHCDRYQLTTRERLDLFMQICEGVQHAHQKAIIHRDLKPSNVLVALRDGKPEPKIIDFGVAKAIAQKLTERTMFTELGVLIGTPEYMSPEQAEMTGQEIDTRTDVYSLGVMLYELLSGALPFDSKELRSAGFDGIRRRIRDEEPPRPSTRLSSLGDDRSKESARLRRLDLPTLRRQLSGDLDWITMKALEKDPGRRYGSPQELAMDIQRYLVDEPVLASPPSSAYRARKFMRRHRAGVGAAMAVFVVLVGASVVSTGLFFKAQREAERARTEAGKSEQVATFMTEMLEAVGPSVARGRDTAMLREVLDETSDRVGTDLTGQPEVEATIRSVLGNTYRELGEYEPAEPHVRTALEIRRRVLGDDHPDTLDSIRGMGSLLRSQGKLEAAEPYYREALEGYRRVLGDDHPDTLGSINSMGLLLRSQGKLDAAEVYYREALEGYRRVLGDDHPATLGSIHNMGALLYSQGKLEAAEPYFREALEGSRRVLGDDHPSTLGSINNMSFLLKSQGKLDEAESYYREALEGYRRVLGDDHPNTLRSINNMGFLLQSQGKLEAAEPYYREALEGRRRVLGDDHPDTLISMGNLGDLLTSLERLAEAERLLVMAVEGVEGSLPREHDITGLTMRKLGRCLTGLERYAEAETALLEAHEVLTAAVGADHAQTRKVMPNLAELYDAWGKPEKAAEWRAKLPDDAE